MLRNKCVMHLVKCSTKFNMSFKGLYLSGSAPWLLEQPESAYNVAWFSKSIGWSKTFSWFHLLRLPSTKRSLPSVFASNIWGVFFNVEKSTVFFRGFCFPFQWPEVRNCPHLTAASELDLKLELSSAWPERSTSFMTGPPNHLIRPDIFLKGVRKGGGWQVDWPLWLVNLEFFRIRNLDLGK